MIRRAFTALGRAGLILFILGCIIITVMAMTPGTAWANHDLRKTSEDLFGPNYWAVWLMVPVPLAIFGWFAWKLYQASKRERER